MGIRNLAIALLLLITIVFVGVFAAIDAFVDTTDNTDPIIRAEDLTTDAIAVDMLVGGLNGMDQEGRFDVTLGIQDINRVLYSLRRYLSYGDFELHSLYLEQVSDGYRLCAPVSVAGIPTLLSGDFDMREDGDAICVTLGDLRVGDYSLDSIPAGLFNIKPILSSAIASSGLNGYFDGSAVHISLDREDMGELIMQGLSSDANVGLYSSLYSLLLLSSDAVDIEIYSPASVVARVDLSVFGGRYSDRLVGVNEFGSSFINSSAISPSELGLTSKYYVNGYSRLNDVERERISAIMPADSGYASYSGIIEREEVSLLSLLLTQLEANTDYLLPGFKIGDGEISSLISDLDLVGSIWQYYGVINKQVAYIAISDVYTSIGDGRIDLMVDVDINGYVITVRSEFDVSESPLVSVSGMLTRLSVGEITLNPFEIDSLMKFLSRYLNSGWISIDPENNTLSLDFGYVFKESPLLYTLISSSKKIVTVCKSGVLGGYLHITFKLF